MSRERIFESKPTCCAGWQNYSPTVVIVSIPLSAEAFSRPDTLHPRVPGVGGNIAAFAAIYRFEFDDARRLLRWAAPYQDMMGPFASVLAHCFGGIAAKYELDIATARREFREAFEIGCTVGSRSHAARLAGALLGELLYEAGELDEATRLLEMSYGLGPEGGGVDYLAARYVGSAKVKAAQGDLSVAAERLDAGMNDSGATATPATRGRDQQRADPIGNRRRAGGGSPPAIRADYSARRRYRHDNR